MKDIVIGNLHADNHKLKSALTSVVKKIGKEFHSDTGDYVFGQVQKSGEFFELPILQRPGVDMSREGDIAFLFAPIVFEREVEFLRATCYHDQTEPYFDKLVDGLAKTLNGEIKADQKRKIFIVSKALLNDKNFSELKRVLATSTADKVKLLSEEYVKIISNLPHGVPIELLEDAARSDSSYVEVDRRAFLRLLNGGAKPIEIANAPARTEQTTWRGNGKPPKTRAEKIKAIQAWDAIPRDERPPLADWLIENFGTDYATEKPNVIESTFHSWRRLKNS